VPGVNVVRPGEVARQLAGSTAFFDWLLAGVGGIGLLIGGLSLSNDPPVLLADEPTGNLDADNARVILDELCGRARSGTAVLLVTHSDALAAAADRVLHLVDGRLVGA
jgi:ABC-type uncharacterized transport system ATPase subunit